MLPSPVWTIHLPFWAKRKWQLIPIMIRPPRSMRDFQQSVFRFRRSVIFRPSLAKEGPGVVVFVSGWSPCRHFTMKSMKGHEGRKRDFLFPKLRSGGKGIRLSVDKSPAVCSGTDFSSFHTRFSWRMILLSLLPSFPRRGRGWLSFSKLPMHDNRLSQPLLLGAPRMASWPSEKAALPRVPGVCIQRIWRSGLSWCALRRLPDTMPKNHVALRRCNAVAAHDPGRAGFVLTENGKQAPKTWRGSVSLWLARTAGTEGPFVQRP